MSENVTVGLESTMGCDNRVGAAMLRQRGLGHVLDFFLVFVNTSLVK